MRIVPIVKEFYLTPNDQTGFNQQTITVVHNMGRTPFKYEGMFYRAANDTWYPYRTAREFTNFSAYIGFEAYPTNSPNTIDVGICATGWNLGNDFPMRLLLYFM